MRWAIKELNSNSRLAAGRARKEILSWILQRHKTMYLARRSQGASLPQHLYIQQPHWTKRVLPWSRFNSVTTCDSSPHSALWDDITEFVIWTPSLSLASQKPWQRSFDGEATCPTSFQEVFINGYWRDPRDAQSPSFWCDIKDRFRLNDPDYHLFAEAEMGGWTH